MRRSGAFQVKMGEQHIVPLSTQAVAILRELQLFTGSGHYVFPSLRTRERPISEVTLNAALRRLGYTSEEQTAHGFRTMASTLLNEQGWHPDLIELQLAHAERNKVRAAYNRAQRLDERRKNDAGAQRLKRPQSFVSAYESGDRKIDVLEFLRIAKATGVDPCELLRRVM